MFEKLNDLFDENIEIAVNTDPKSKVREVIGTGVSMEDLIAIPVNYYTLLTSSNINGEEIDMIKQHIYNALNNKGPSKKQFKIKQGKELFLIDTSQLPDMVQFAFKKDKINFELIPKRSIRKKLSNTFKPHENNKIYEYGLYDFGYAES